MSLRFLLLSVSEYMTASAPLLARCRRIAKKANWRVRVTGSSEPDAKADLGLVLEAEETIVARLTGLGAMVIATTQRLVVVRDGAGFRPRSGVRSWPHDAKVKVSLAAPRQGQARIVVRGGGGADNEVSMFFTAERWPEAERLVSEVKRLTRLHGEHG
jgi:hypothetical protein